VFPRRNTGLNVSAALEGGGKRSALGGGSPGGCGVATVKVEEEAGGAGAGAGAGAGGIGGAIHGEPAAEEVATVACLGTATGAVA
jgi:hypothetical protein